MSLSLLTFNTFGAPYFARKIKQRYQKIAEIINAENIDILCLQEVSTYYHLFLLKKYIRHYPYHCYRKYLFGPKGGVVIFSKIPLEKCSYSTFSALGKLHNYTQLIKNGMLICKIKGQKTYLLTTHLISDFEFDASTT